MRSGGRGTNQGRNRRRRRDFHYFVLGTVETHCAGEGAPSINIAELNFTFPGNGLLP